MSTPVIPQRAPRAAPRKKRPSQARVTVFAFLYGAFAAGAVYFGVLFVTNLSQIASTGGDLVQTIITNAPGIPSPIQVADPNRAPKIEDRYTILLMGNDARPDEDKKLIRTDTMMLLTVDPINHTAALMTIPRDLFVPIPVGTGTSREVIQTRINEAYQLGYLRNYPGGGPALAMKTVEYNFGVPINNYAMIDFPGFIKAVDTVGGIQVDVPSRIVDFEYPTMDYGYMTIRFEPGTQNLNGERALIYARTRHQDNDFGRSKRQQQVLLALRDKALQLNMLPRLPQLAGQFADSIQTDVSLPQALTLANLVRGINREDIQTVNIEPPAVVDANIGGASVLLPQRDDIAKLVTQTFYDPRQKQEAARVQISNASRVRGVAQQAADLLAKKGWEGVQVVNAEAPAEQTVIYDYSGKKYSAQLLAKQLNVPENRIQERRVPNSPVDIEVVVGADVRLPQAAAR